MTAKLSNIVVVLFTTITIFCCTYVSYYSNENQTVIAQKSSNSSQAEPANGTRLLLTQHLTEPMGVKINSPHSGQEVPVGELSISGTSTDTADTDCNVLVDVNDIKPLQNTIARGLGGQGDYSNWTFTYTKNYHLITEGSNELTAKLSCNENYLNNSTGNGSTPISNFANGKAKWYSINVTGTAVPSTNDEQNRNKTQNQTQSANSSKQNATVSNYLQPDMSDQNGTLGPSDSSQKQKLSTLDEEELTILSRESSRSQEFQPHNQHFEKDELDKSSSSASSLDLMEESDSTVQEFIPSSDIRAHDTPSNNEDRLAYGMPEREELQTPMQMADLHTKNDAGTQQTKDIQSNDIPDEDNRIIPQEDELEAQIQDVPVQDTDIGPPLQMFNTDKEGETAPDEEQASQIDDEEEDDSDSMHSANDIYEIITGHSEEQIDTEQIDTEQTQIGQDIQGRDAGNIITEEIPLVQSYTRDIESTLE